jgi:5-formyltetrahydrofolate cyclo-ligase
MSDPEKAARKKEIRDRLRAARREYAAALPPQESALIFHRPPAAVVGLVPEDAVIGLYRADPGEAPASGYAKFFFERGHTIALPWLVNLQTPIPIPTARPILPRAISG